MSFWRKSLIRKSTNQDSLAADEIYSETVLGVSRIKRIPLDTLSRTEYRGLVFLFADDNIDQQKIMEIFFTRYGAIVDFAENGQKAWQMYEDTPDKYNIIFMDIQMPVLNGDESARKIRSSDTQRAKTIPIVSLSGHAFWNSAEESIYDFLLCKPFQMEQLAYAIEHIMKKQ